MLYCPKTILSSNELADLVVLETTAKRTGLDIARFHMIDKVNGIKYLSELPLNNENGL